MVYREFAQAVADVVLNQRLLRSMVPNAFVGALWTTPVHFRRLRHMDAVIRRLLQATTDLQIVGNPEPRAAASVVLERLGRLAQSPVPMRRSEVESLSEGADIHIAKIGQALGDFYSAARVDLGHDKWRVHFWQVWRSAVPTKSVHAGAGDASPAGIGR